MEQKDDIFSADLINSYLNDGFIYCILTNLKNREIPLVKIGKIEIKRQDTEEQVYNKLLRRYNTYYPEYSVIHFKRTGNCHLAEVLVFKELKELHYTKEMYLFNESEIQEAFIKASDRYPCVDELLKTCYNINVLNNTNELMRKLSK